MEKNNEIKHRIAHTFAEDMAKVIEDDKSGLIKKIIHEEEEHEIEKRNLSPESKKNKLFMLASFLLIVFGVIIVCFFFLKKDSPTVPVEQQFTPIIFTDKSALVEVVGLKKDDMESEVLNEVNKTSVKNGGVEGIYLTLNNNPVGFKQFIELINGNFIPGSGNFVNDNFLMGTYKNNDQTLSNNFFILLKVRSITDIFSAVRAWENKMFSDLHGFFGIDISTATKSLLTADFKDSIVGNKNARILYDADGKVMMMYIFADDNSIIITNTINAAQEIMLRLAASQVKK